MQRGVPGVTSPGVTDRKLPRTGWPPGRALLLRVAGYCVCCCDYTLCDRERQPSESRVWSTAGTVILPTNMTRNHNKLPSTGQGPGGANRTSGGKLPNQAAGPREVVEQ